MSMGSSSAQPHISSALQGHHDSGIPSFLPLMFAFNSGFICGVLNFGEAISFSLQWNVARYLGLLGPDTTFAKGVMLSQVTFFSIAVESIPCCSHPSHLDIIIPFQQFCNSRLSVFVHSICHSPVHFWLEGGSSHARLQCHRHRHRQPCAPDPPFDCSDFCFTRACSSSKWGCICLFLETLKPSNGSARHCLCCFHFQS